MNYDHELVTWSNTFDCGVKIINDQHKELLNLTNELFNHCKGNPKSEFEYFKSVIDKAVDYVKVHFQTEEKIMITTKFTGYAAHKKEHDQFVLNVVEAVQEVNKTGKVDLINFTRFLKNWILTHIAVTDRLYFEYFKKIATKKSDGRLTISKEDLKNS